MSEPDKPMETSAVARPGAFLGQISSNVRTTAATICRDSAPGTILDVGCGNGLLFAEIGNVGTRFFGVDADPQLLVEGRRILEDNEVGPAQFALGDAGHLPFLAATFDKVLLLNTLINIPTDALAAAFLAELVRITRPGGEVIVDIRNNANLPLRARYWLHNRRADFTTRGHGLRQVRGVFAALGCEVGTVHRIGPWLPFGPSGLVIRAFKQPD